jgi:hypothetical protein
MTILPYINAFSVGAAIVAFAGILIWNHARKRHSRLDAVLTRVLAASAIPTGITLLVCAFNPSLIAQLQGLNVHIAVAGMALLFIAVRTVFTDGGG